VERIAATSSGQDPGGGGLMARLDRVPPCRAAGPNLGRDRAAAAHPVLLIPWPLSSPFSPCWWSGDISVLRRNPPVGLAYGSAVPEAMRPLGCPSLLGAVFVSRSLSQGVQATSVERWDRRLTAPDRNDLFATPWSSRSASTTEPRWAKRSPAHQMSIALAEVFGSGCGRGVGPIWVNPVW